eukprot:TRINITY_DN25027_c0_g1_i1.p1 TRINITY_DN25027_c0_g1~~TRINITY_DN25027_c0_g1_i1.p1  ORF type:complete len:848 (-),score=132.65 TRINITY_DN25027_c0_g1_i1:57-2600(-)
MAMLSPFRRQGRGAVPAGPLLSEAWKEAWEVPGLALCHASSLGFGRQLDFTAEGVTMEQFTEFFKAAMEAAKKAEPIVEAGNKYSVYHDFKRLNGELLLHELEQSDAYAALSGRDQARATEFAKFVYLNGELRNRNPLHPNHLDSAVLGNLLNFPKHIFGFPCAGYATNGNESLSLILFSYRSEFKKNNPCVLYVQGVGEEEPGKHLIDCAKRLNLQFRVVAQDSLCNEHAANVAVVMASFSNSELQKAADWAVSMKLGLHIHMSDKEIRRIFAENPKPVHFDLPSGVRSMSLEEGLFRSAYQLYRDTQLRDTHHDLPLIWQSAYISPNEGGSGNTTPLYTDFCMILLGWSALHDIAQKTSAKTPECLRPMELSPCDNWTFPIAEGKCTVEEALEFGRTAMKMPREDVEKHVLQFQRNFVGGKRRSVEAVVSAGGTRSGNFAFESVMARAATKLGPGTRIKLIVGNPHLLVERAERRFQFEVIRVHRDGVICIDGLKDAISDPAVAAVYTQTLSITDGITDPLPDVLRVVEEENRKRQANGGLLVTIINDNCLALSVLIHNDGNHGSQNLRMLDLTEKCITPTMMMLDAHKHLGADKGLSMVMGTPGTLSALSGHVKVGAQPSHGELVRGLADMLLVGTDGYYEKYRALAASVAEATKTMSTAGMKLIHSQNVVTGSTAFGVEDPSGCIGKRLKKQGHFPSPLFGVAPEHPSRCQSGFLLHVTPHALRTMENGQRAFDIFVTDAVKSYRHVSANYSSAAKCFRENSLPAFLLAGGNEELWSFELLRRPGFGRDFMQLFLRRIYSGILDSGVICTQKRPAALRELLKRVLLFVVVLFSLRRLRRRLGN